MWLPLVLVVVVGAPAAPSKQAPVTKVKVIEAAPVFEPEPELEPVVAPASVPVAADVAPAAVVATEAMPTPSSRVRPLGVALEVGVDVPSAQRLPMASTRLDFGWKFALPASTFAGIGLRTGYSYVAGEVAVADPVLGVDNHALLMAHRVPLRAVGRLGLQGDGVEVGVLASGGADFAFLQAQSFGRVAAPTALMPAGSVGGFVDVALGDALSLGLVGEWDAAVADLAALTPGLSGDLSALRLAVSLHFSFG